MPGLRQHETISRSSIALVDGDPAMRRARQLMFRAEGYEVQAYPTCGALLADPSAMASACLVADVEMADLGGVELVEAMRRAGWHGSAILLADAISPALAKLAQKAHFTAMFPKALADRPLLDAVNVAIGKPAPALV
jgi:FixJ family two-component response regulator